MYETATTPQQFIFSQDNPLAPIPTNAFRLNVLELQNAGLQRDLQGWYLSNRDDSILLTPPDLPSNPKQQFHLSLMPSRADTMASDISRSAGNRWRLNANGHVVDADVTSSAWNLADDLNRLQISEANKNGADLPPSTVRTPPKSLLASAVPQLNENNSPIDSSSNTSIGSSPHTPDHQLNVAHSRGSSTDTTTTTTTTTSASHDSSSGAQNGLLNRALNGPVVESKERPRSFSGGFSNADLRRLQQIDDNNDRIDAQQWISNQFRDNSALQNEQLQYPTLTHIHRPQPLSPAQLYDYRAATAERDDAQLDYNPSQQRYSTLPQTLTMSPVPQLPFAANRPNDVVANIPNVGYRQPLRTFSQIPNPSPLAFPGHHSSHLSLGNTQQLYEMMMPQEAHPAVTRVQQQHNVFRHHHSASDPSAMRDAASLSLLNGANLSFAQGLYPPTLHPSMSMFPNQFYGNQEVVAAQMAAAARIPNQFTGSYNLPASPENTPSTSSTPTTSGQPGPSANNRKLGLYKTELCRSWEEKGTCRYGAKCQFAHGEEELRRVARHPKYKTEICRTFWVSGSCPYGKRCCFIHTELPTNGTSPNTPGSENPPEPRPRSMSTNSDPNDSSVSLLARISAKRSESTGSNLATPVDLNKPGFQFGRPPTAKLRVDTTVPSMKQNKSAYPSFTSNGILLPASEQTPTQEPAPVTAGPDLGRSTNARMEIVGYNNQTTPKKTTANSSIRHSFNGTEIDLNLGSLPTPTGPSHNYTLSTADGSTHSAPRVNGHVRAGSTGTWPSFPRSQLSNTSYPGSSSPAAERIAGPWSNDISIGAARLHEKAWA